MDSFWNDWQPGERATLCFVIKDGRILLIHKKRGLGAGKINGPGGRIEPGESPLECAIRETHEELGIEVLDVHRRGELHFQFLDGYSLHCTVFVAGDLRGEPVETDEALPLWTSVEEIPYDRMWEDDRHWLPGVVEGGSFRGYFRFDGEKMLTHEVFWEH
jgi:8-oxo-dGTP diphosphatase